MADETPGRPCCQAALDSEGITHDHAEWFAEVGRLQYRLDHSQVERDQALAERDALAARLAAAEKVVEDVKRARRHLRSALVAVTPLLDVPYIDAPQQTPWSRFVKPAMRALDTAVDAYRTHEPEPEQT